MSITNPAIRFAIIAGVLFGAATADAKPRRVVILDFDGPRGLADAGRTEVQKILGEQYDVVAKKRWEDARARAQQKSAGPQTWQKAAKTSGVDAIIEGWVQDEGRHKLLTVAIREASTGQELDTVSVRVGTKGLSDDSRTKLSDELDGVLAYIEGAPEPTGSALRVIETRKMIGAKTPKVDAPARAEEADELDEDQPRRKNKKRVAEATEAEAETADADADADEPKPKTTKRKRFEIGAEIQIGGNDSEESDQTEAKPTKAKREVAASEPSLEDSENSDLVTLFGASSIEGKTAIPEASHVPVPTKRFQISAGAFYGTRSLNMTAEEQTGPQPYSGVPSKGFQVQGAVYPFPTKKFDGGLSGVGFTFGLTKSAGSEVSFDDGETVSEYVINQSSYEAGIHYRRPLASLLSIDGGVSYGKSSYLIPDAPQAFEVPDTEYSYVGGAVHLDLTITERASVGFGAKYMYLLDVGDISSVDWYGPGRASGLGFDASFVIPLPHDLYVNGKLKYEKFRISYDGVGVITEQDGVSESNDATVNGSIDVGIQF